MMTINNCIVLLLALQLCMVYLKFINQQYHLGLFFWPYAVSIMKQPNGLQLGKLSFFRDHPTNLKDSFRFIDNIKNKCFQNKIMVSFDVKCLFTNIPVSFTIKLIIDALYQGSATPGTRADFLWHTR